MDSILFHSGAALIRTAVLALLAYVTLVLLLRVSGRRTLSKMNAFDLVVTVALGSTLAAVILNRNVTLAQGGVAFALLIVMQYAVTWTSVRVAWVRRLVTGEPALLLYDGCMLPAAMRRSRVTEEELFAAVRAAGHAAIERVRAVVLETDGSFSVIAQGDDRSASALENVRAPGPGGQPRR